MLWAMPLLQEPHEAIGAYDLRLEMMKTKAEAELTEDDLDETMASNTMAGELSVAGSKTSSLDQPMGKSYHPGVAFTFEQNLGIRLNRGSGPDA
ncbi:uncharacterized protein L3040_007793 [Drepanopeziza brunnea f. sp. 'multigermtubi']|uniref:uncharacterized protein n=1 Tax=Drepanopeziza brunnea f. sp. 'multigermtubi' TaxID=698441 RepID=UPI00238842BF|nr:hypothetical protein L3040_007793 [Drepanopeziza brunnea f. sp. 'multigermtubi']